MHPFLPLLTVFLFTITLSGQDSTDHVAYLPAGSVRVESGRPDNADTRFLSAIYQTINYPRRARAYGITGAVFVTYTIDTMGVLTISDTKFLSPKELTERPMRMRKSDVLRVTAYTVGGSSYSGSATTNRKQLEKGQADLREEVSRTLLKLPTFVPARRAGQAVEDTQVKLIYFAIE